MEKIIIDKEKYLKRRRTNMIAVITLMTLSFILGFLILSIYNDMQERPILNTYIYPTPTNAQDVIGFCANKSLEDTSKCLRGMFRNIYNYSLEARQIPRNYSFEYLIKSGGACFEWNTWYGNIASELNFSVYYITINNTGPGHYVTIIYDDTGYCLLDQTRSPKCNLDGNSPSGIQRKEGWERQTNYG